MCVKASHLYVHFPLSEGSYGMQDHLCECICCVSACVSVCEGIPAASIEQVRRKDKGVREGRRGRRRRRRVTQ